MAEKKSVLGTILAVGAVAAAGTAAYLKRNELKKAADDIMSKFKAGADEGVYGYDRDEDGEIDVVVADTDGDGNFDTMLMDNDGDGAVDEIAVDTTGDGEMDTVTPVVCEESDFEK